MVERCLNVYEHALRIIRRQPDVTAVGVAWREHEGIVYALACGCAIDDHNGVRITGARIAESEHMATLQAVASLRACQLARRELRELLEQQP